MSIEATTAREKCSCSRPSSSPALVVASAYALPLALGVAAASFRLILWRARIASRWLEEDASRVWTDGSMMLDCSDEELHQSIIQCAVDRGNNAIGSCVSGSDDASRASGAARYYQNSSLSGDSSENDTSSSSNDVEGRSRHGLQEQISKPLQTANQVGGIASHKRPVLSFNQFIMKPMRLFSGGGVIGETGRPSPLKAEGGRADQHAPKDSNDGKVDVTKAFRGVREIAFYEALEFASNVPKDGSRFSDHDGDIRRRHEVLNLLSLYNASSPGIATAIVQAASFIESRWYTSTGHRKYAQIMECNRMMPPILPSTRSNTPRLGYFDSMALLAAHNAGDGAVVTGVQSYAMSWRALVREVEALKLLVAHTSPYAGLVDLDVLSEDRATCMSPKRMRRQIRLQNPHLLLRNLTSPFSQPNVIDIKMGTQTYEPTAPPSKQMRDAAKYPLQSVFGFRIIGMRVYSPSSSSDDHYQCWDKNFGVSLTTRDSVLQALVTFLKYDGSTSSASILSRIIEQLTQIKHWFEGENTSLSFYSSSILIAYEGDATLHGVHNDPVVKMIDFSHVCRQSGGDLGYLKGVCNLLSILFEIRDNIN